MPRWSGDESCEVERLREHRQFPKLRLVDNPQARKELAQDAVENGGLDVARVIDGVDSGAIPLDSFAAVDPHPDAAEPLTQPNPYETDLVEE